MRISTKKGDTGLSSLFNGKKLKKSEAVFEVLGNLDELNAFIGWAKVETRDKLREHLERIQDDIYRIMSLIGNEMAAPLEIKKIDNGDIEYLEGIIGEIEEKKGLLNKFIKPGENERSARMHICRSVCRRAERSIVRLGETGNADTYIVKYLNRLSDLFFLFSL